MGRIILKGANLLDGRSPARPGCTVVVEGQRVTHVTTEAVQVLPEDREIDLAGRTLMPGLCSGHFHASYHDYALEIFPLGIDKPPGYLTLRAAHAVRGALMAGFTSVAGAGGGDDIDVQLKMAIDDGLIPGPRILACSRDFTTRGGYVDLANWWWRLGNVGAGLVRNGPEALREAAREEMARGAEILKLYVTGGHGNVNTAVREFSRDELEMVVRTAHERGRKVRAHCAWKPAILECIELGVDVIDHGDEIDAECIGAMVEAGTVLVPSALYLERLLGLEAIHAPGYEALVETTERELENLLRWIPEANAAGVKLVLGDDYGTIVLRHGAYADELEFYVKRAGIAPLDVIRWATVHGADLMGLGDELGSVEEGRLADLLVVDGDPSVDITVLKEPHHLRMIFKGGQLVKDALEPGPSEHKEGGTHARV
ncbi:MAG: amidohydrolase family protein [Myxococcota bacterium]